MDVSWSDLTYLVQNYTTTLAAFHREAKHAQCIILFGFIIDRRSKMHVHRRRNVALAYTLSQPKPDWGLVS